MTTKEKSLTINKTPAELGKERREIYESTDQLSAEQVSRIREIEKIIFYSVCSRMQVHPRSVVILKPGRSTRHPLRRVDDTATWVNPQYYIERDGAYYTLDFDYDDGGERCEASLTEFPPEELLVKFAAIAAAREMMGGSQVILPIDHPDYQSDGLIPDTSDVNVEKVSIKYRHSDGDYDGPDARDGVETFSSTPFGEV